jgi:hypothetical protein
VTPDEVPDGPLCVDIDTDVFSLVFTRKGRFGDFLPLIEGRVLAVSFAVVAELRAGAIKAGFTSTRAVGTHLAPALCGADADRQCGHHVR